MPLLLELHLHTLAATRAVLHEFLRVLLPRLATLVLLVKTKAADTIAVERTEGRKNSALAAGHGW